MSLIVPGIYVGGLTSAKSKQQLEDCGITHICSVLHQEFKEFHRKHLFIYADDSPTQNLSMHFEDTCLFIHEARCAGGTVLIHCACGASRSVTITLAYLLVVTELPLSKLFKAVQGARHCACPNSGFMTQLIDFEKSKELVKLRDKLSSGFPDWSSERQQADISILEKHLKVQEYFILHGAYPEDVSSESHTGGDVASDTGPTPDTACGTIVPEKLVPHPLNPSRFTVYLQDKPTSLEEFIAMRSSGQFAKDAAEKKTLGHQDDASSA